MARRTAALTIVNRLMRVWKWTSLLLPVTRQGNVPTVAGRLVEPAEESSSWSSAGRPAALSVTGPATTCSLMVIASSRSRRLFRRRARVVTAGSLLEGNDAVCWRSAPALQASSPLFSGTNWPATNVAPCGSLISATRDHGASRGPLTTSPPSSVARAATASTSSTPKVTSQCAAVGVVVAGDRLQRRDHVDEAGRGAHLLHLGTQARRRLLEVVAIARQASTSGPPPAPAPPIRTPHRRRPVARSTSRVASPLKFNAPCSLTTVAPLCRPACHRWNDAPSGSVTMAIRPASRRRTAPRRRCRRLADRGDGRVDVVDPDVGVPRRQSPAHRVGSTRSPRHRAHRCGR